MRVDLPIAAYAIAGTGAEHAPVARREALPPPGTKRRGGRAPLLATALAVRTGADRSPEHRGTAVLFGTGLGCLTETELFVENMIRAEEATPKPRAFTSSVHNAIASRVALDLGATGECQTFVQGEVSFAHALFAATLTRSRSDAPLLVGAIDESVSYVERALERCGVAVLAGEGGAVLRIDEPAIARVIRVVYGRATDSSAWFDREVTDPGPVRLIPGITGSALHIPLAEKLVFDGIHASLAATATALAAGIFAGEVDPSALDLEEVPERITLVPTSRFGDYAVIQIARF